MFLKFVLAASIIVIASTAHSETIKVGGTGSMIPLLNDLATAYLKKNPKDTVEVNQKSLGQPGGIAALNAGAIDIAMSGTPLTEDQLKLPVKPYFIATVAGVVAVSNDVSVGGISSQQLCDIYSGRIRNWKQVGGRDSAIQVFTRPESDTTKIKFREAFACMANLKDGSDVMNLPKSQDMFKALETRKSAIGIVDGVAMSDAAGKFKALKIDGRGYEQYESGQWPYVLRNHLVVSSIRKNDGVRRFLEFVKSPAGKAIIRNNKAKPENYSL